MTLKNFLTLLLVTVCVGAAGQKFMIKDNDTLPYFTKIAEGTCETFEKLNGAIVNRTDASCLRQGLWIITDSLGSYWTGTYQDNVEIGLWKHFDKNGRLLKETESISVGKETYKIREVDYLTGHAVTIIDKPFLAFFLKYIYIITGLFFVTFFARVFINSRIYNVENGTKYSAMYLSLPGYVSTNFTHSLLCTFSFWFSNYKPQNKKLVIISNILSIISLGIFFGILIGLAINGELH